MQRRLLTALIATVPVVLALGLCAAGAGAAPLPFLTQTPEDGLPGAEAGRIDQLRGIAVDPHLPGDVYVVDIKNMRVDVFTPWGEFVRAWGWGVKDGKSELQTCTTQTGCTKGLEGSGNGQFKEPEAIAVDGKGDVYVIEAENHRVQEFDPEGKFILAFGSAGTGPGQFGGGFAAYLAQFVVSPVNGDVFVGEAERVQVFAANGTFVEDIAMPVGKKVEALAVDKSGKLYVAFESDPLVRKLEPAGPTATFLEPSFEAEHEPSFKAALPTSLTLDASGDLYMVTARYFGAAGTEEPDQVLQFDPSGKCVDCGINGEGGKPGFDRTTESQLYDIAAGGACGSNDVYVAHFNPATHGPSSERSFFSVWGSPPDLAVCPQPVHAPEVRAQFAVSVESGSASLRAQIGPRFWPDTSYHLEYGRQPCSLGGCQSTGSLALTSQVTSAVLTTPSVLLEGLSPGTTYYYRFVATSGGGGPVYGVDPDGSGPGEASFAAGVEGSFRTYRPAGVVSCSTNEAFRVGPSSLLPDCRAFELVSPLDKENGDIAVLVSSPNLLPSVLEQASVDGGKLAYGSYRSFGGAPSAPYTSQYVAVRRDGEGWASHPVSPPRGKAISTIGVQTRPEFRAFSPDLCEAWSWRTAEPPLAASAPTGNVDLYRHRDGECGGSGYVPLNTTSATVGLDLELQGRSADGSTAIFTADRPLEKGASTGQTQLYGVRAGVEQFLCVLPGGSAYAGSCSAGWSFERNFNGEENELAGALSNDGNRVFWTAAWGGAGKIYLRENPFAKASKECSGEAAQCTLEVSKAAEALAGTKGSQFWAAARDGSKAIFTTGPAAGESDLYEYRVADQSTHPIAGKVHGLMGVSSDGSRVYFASREALGGVNGEGKTAVAGEENLYMYEAGEAAGSFRFIGVLSGQDLVRPSPIEADLSRHDAQVSGDGLSAVFESYARLTGYDNTDRNSGQRDAELFVYDARGNEGKGRLVCASCNPGGARPAGAEYIRFHAAGEHGPWTAARIPVSEDVLYASRVLSDNGKRVFFDAYDSLTPRDGNGREDVYEWEAPGEGTCTEAASSYSPVNGGCVELVSSGQSRIDSEFVDATPSGNDVFFATLSSLLAQDYGLMDIYDARVDGGLPAPVVVGAGCEGEACQSPTVPPASSAFGSLTFSGEGNLLVSPVVSVKPKALTRAQRLAQALKRCRRMHVKHRRVACERGARKRLGAKQARVKRRRASRREG